MPFAVSCVFINVELNTTCVCSQCSDRTGTITTANSSILLIEMTIVTIPGTAVKNVAYNRDISD